MPAVPSVGLPIPKGRASGSIAEAQGQDAKKARMAGWNGIPKAERNAPEDLFAAD